jgi:hypothetical protein
VREVVLDEATARWRIRRPLSDHLLCAPQSLSVDASVKRTD